jgi:hypothetical protein
MFRALGRLVDRTFAKENMRRKLQYKTVSCLGDIARGLGVKVRRNKGGGLSNGRLAVCGKDRHDEDDAPGIQTRGSGRVGERG